MKYFSKLEIRQAVEEAEMSAFALCFADADSTEADGIYEFKCAQKKLPGMKTI